MDPDRWVWWIAEDDEQYRGFHQATLAWVRSLGLDPERLAPRAAVVQHDGRYELHVDEIQRGFRGGQPAGDRADPLNWDQLLTVRRIVPVAENSWPTRPVVEVAA